MHTTDKPEKQFETEKEKKNKKKREYEIIENLRNRDGHIITFIRLCKKRHKNPRRIRWTAVTVLIFSLLRPLCVCHRMFYSC